MWLVDLRPKQLQHESVVATRDGPAVPGDTGLCHVVYEPWVCEECLTFALARCPGLLRLHKREAAPLRLLSVREAQYLAAPAEVEGPRESQMVCRFVMIVPVVATRVDPADFLAARRLRLGSNP